MPVFAYKAIDTAGQVRSGTLTADTAFAGRQVLRQSGWQIREFEAARTRGRLLRLHRRRRQTDEIASLARNLALLLKAGVPLTEALDVLSQQYPGQLRATLQDVREQVNSGASLAEAMGRHTNLFDVVWQSAVHVGEVSGTLDVSLRELGQYLEARHNLRSRLSASLIYPVILLCMATGIVVFLMRFVVPQILQVLIASGRALPASTRMLMHLSDLLVNHWLVVLGLFGGTVAAIVAVPRTPLGRRTWHRLQLRLPILGPLLRKAIVAEYAQMSAMLLRSNVPFTQAMKAILTTARHEVLKEELQRIITAVEAGSNIAVAMRPTRLFPPLVIHLMAVGQDTGELTEMLEQLRTSYDEEVRLAATKFNAALEPLLIILIAGTIGFIVFATIMPILEAARAIQ
jgi:general secretion pathway protein F